MSTLTYDVGASAPVKAAISVRKPNGLFARMFGRLMEARQKQAELELARHGLRLPRELEEAGLKINRRNEDSLPFVR